MPVNDINVQIDGPRLNIYWTNPVIPGYAIVVQVSKNIEFIGSVRNFVMPMTTGAGLDLGVGPWFIRVGILNGTPHSGSVDWSGIYGPYITNTGKLSVGLPNSVLKILHTQPILHGVRFHTGIALPYYVMVDVSKNSEGFGAGVSRTQYSYDTGRGYFDVIGLDYAHTYNFRIFAFLEGLGDLPTDTVKVMGQPVVVSGKRPAKQIRKIESSVSTASKAEDTILKDLSRKPNISFSSHAQYLKYLAAKAKTSENISANTVRP